MIYNVFYITVSGTGDSKQVFAVMAITLKPQEMPRTSCEAFFIGIATTAIRRVNALLLDSYKGKRTPKVEACRTVISELSKVATIQILTLKGIWPVKTAGSRRVCKIFVGG